ncbi:MAG: AMP-binding protein [Pseudomonadota bacterium]
MLDDGLSYETLYAGFRWPIPERYSIAQDCCDQWAAREPDRAAIIHEQDDGSILSVTYRQIRDQANRLANALSAHGIAAGDRVAILLPQRPETAIAHIACYKIGAIAVPLASVFAVEALTYRFQNAGIGTAITDREGCEKIIALSGDAPDLRLIIDVDGPSGTSDGPVHGLAGLISRASDRFETPTFDPDQPAMMIYTSGTTGPPKGALHGHRVLLGHVPGVQMPHEALPQPGDVLWTPADWAWAGGLLNVLLPGLRFGVPVVSYAFRKFDPEKAFTLMADHKIRNLFVPPTALKMMRPLPDPRARFDLALRTIGSGGEALGSETYDWARDALGLTINEFYGQTECNLVLASSAALGVSRAGAIGKPVPGHDVAIIDETGARCPTGSLGEIAVRRPDPVMFLEYWRNPEATREKFIGDWLKTGDRGMMDEDGYVHFIGRDDDVITSAGYRIGPAEIEDCLVSHPAVALAAVVGKPDPIRTEIVKAYVVVAPGHAADAALGDTIRAHVRNRLAAHEYPREVEFVADIPLTTTGKVIRRHFRDQARREAEGEAGGSA